MHNKSNGDKCQQMIDELAKVNTRPTVKDVVANHPIVIKTADNFYEYVNSKGS